MNGIYWFGFCGCTVWPMMYLEPYGPCGRCGNKPTYLPNPEQLPRSHFEEMFDIKEENRGQK